MADSGLLAELRRIGALDDAVGSRAKLRLSQVSGHPALMRRLADIALAHIHSQAEPFDGVAATSTATLHLTSLLAAREGVPMAYLRARAKSHGKQKQMEGQLPPGGRVLLIGDPSAGPGALEGWTGSIAEQGARASHCLWLVPSEGEETGTAACTSSVLFRAEEAALAGGAVRDAEQAAGSDGAPGGDTGARNGWPSAAARARAVAQALLDAGAVTVNRAQPYRYTSGLLSPIYTDNRLLISHPRSWATVVTAFLDELGGDLRSGSVDVLVGMSTSGIPHAGLIADTVDLPLGYVEGEGDGARLEGGLAGGSADGRRRTLIVEDLVTTGGSVVKTAQALREHGFEISRCVAIFTYGRPQVRETFAGIDLPLTTLSDLDTLLDLAVETCAIEPSDREAVLEWLRDAAAWSEAAEQRLAGAAAR